MIVRYSRAAQADIQAIHDYIAQQDAQGAQRVVQVIAQSIQRLADFPLSGRNGAVETTRELVIPRLPYIAVYRVAETRVEVIAIFHAARDIPRGEL